jgi:hypothetical protein
MRAQRISRGSVGGSAGCDLGRVTNSSRIRPRPDTMGSSGSGSRTGASDCAEAGRAIGEAITRAVDSSRHATKHLRGAAADTCMGAPVSEQPTGATSVSLSSWSGYSWNTLSRTGKNLVNHADMGIDAGSRAPRLPPAACPSARVVQRSAGVGFPGIGRRRPRQTAAGDGSAATAGPPYFPHSSQGVPIFLTAAERFRDGG